MPEQHHSNDQEETPSIPTVPAHTEPIGSENALRPKTQQDERPHWADRTIAIFTVLIFLTYITSDYFLWRQLKITNGQLEQNKASIRLEQRAWITVVPGVVSMTNGQVIQANVRVTNTGKTPAEHLTGHVITTFLKAGERPDFNYGPGHLQGLIECGTLLPNNEQTPIILAVGAPPGGESGNLLASDALRRDVESGAMFSVTYGRLTYSDIFGTEHWLTFCMNGTGTPYKKKSIEGCAECNAVDHNQ
jgi:hypothetical protein